MIERRGWNNWMNGFGDDGRQWGRKKNMWEKKNEIRNPFPIKNQTLNR